MRRTVHVGQEMDQMLDQKQHGRVVEVAVLPVAQTLDGFLDSHQRIAGEIALGILEILVDGYAVVEPLVRVAALGHIAHVIHPRGVVDDVVVSLEVLGNVLLRLGSHILPSLSHAEEEKGTTSSTSAAAKIFFM